MQIATVVKIAENGNVTATGTITGNQQTFANYTNTYKADPGTLDGSANLKVKKEFQLLESYDMTLEATLTKLMYLMKRFEGDYDAIRRHFYREINHDILCAFES